MMPFTYKCPRCGFMEESQEPPAFIHICYKCGKIDIPLYSVDLDYVRPENVIAFLQGELRRRELRDKVKVKLFWTDRTGKKCEVSKMTKTHVRNIIRRVEKYCIKF